MHSRFSFTLLLGLLICNFTGLAAAQDFDEQFDLWPINLKINGTVIAGGGGDMPSEAYEMYSKAAKVDEAQPVKVRIGSSDNERQSKSGELLKLEDVKVIEISAGSATLSNASTDAIKGSKAIWIEADQKIRKAETQVFGEVLAAAKLAIDSGATVCLNGKSAEYLGRLKSESLFNLTSTSEASNIVPDSVVLSGYRDETHRKDLLEVLATNARCVGIGIEPDTAIVLRGRKIRVIGEATTFCLIANEKKPLRVQHVRQAKSRRANPYETIVDLTAWRRDAIERTVEPFPATEPPKPLVENGTLMIVGGGGLPENLMEDMVKLAGGKKARMVYVPCSERDEITGPQRTVEAWKKMGVASATFIHTKDRNKANSDEEFLAPLKNATGIWFGGGRQWNFSDSYYGTKAHELMKQVLDRGGVIGGSSAGALIQARYMCRANPVANFDIMAPGYERGLGFIGGVAIDQHFSQRGRQKDMTQLVDRYPQLLGIGIDEGTAVIVNKSEAKVVGKGKVHFYDRTQAVIPGEDDFMALKSGEIYDLMQRKVVTEAPVAEKDE